MGDNQLQEIIAELQEVIWYMRIEREQLDAQREELKTSSSVLLVVELDAVAVAL